MSSGETREYVYATDGNQGHWLTGEEIVRCRDCEYARAGEAVIGGNWQHGSCELPRFKGSLHRCNVTADGFCAWGERKVSE